MLSSPQPPNIVSPYFNTSQASQQQPHPSQPTAQQAPPLPLPPLSKQLQSQSKQASSPSQTGQPSVSLFDSISSLSSNSSSILASSGLLAAVQDPKDLLLSEILDQVWNMQQEMNIESSQTTVTASAHSTTDDSMLLDMLDEVLDPPAPNVTIPLSISSPLVSSVPDSQASSDLNEKLAISAIQRQLMSFETHTPQSSHHTSNQTRPPTYTQPNYSNNASFQQPLGPTGLMDGLNVIDKKVSL